MNLELLPYGTFVSVHGRKGIICSISRLSYGVKTGDGEVHYVKHESVSP
jgi:hypothetical protein